ncbi:MAG: type IV secretion system DNA-binding domain-containing protein [Clostridia bacterium]|nr:type IV secretion system DNA-binding domain-containing protein [Clostridia bacterium]
MIDPKILEGLKLEETTPSFVLDDAKYYFKSEDSRIPLNDEIMTKHILYTGTIGTGKTTAIFQLLDQIVEKMSSDDVMVLFDTKGDYQKRYFRPGKDVIISCDDKATDYWNIFREAMVNGEEKVEENLLEIVNSLFSEKIKRSNAPFFPMAAKDVLFGIMSYIIYKNDIEDIDNAELYAYLRDANINDVIDALTSYGDLKGIIDYIYSGGDGFTDQTQGVYSELRNVANELFIGNFRRGGDFSVRDFVRNKGGRILFIEYDLSIGSVLTPVYRVLMDLAIKEALSRNASEGNVYFVIDEFKLLPSLYHIDDGVNFGRSLGAKFIVAMQNVQQIIDGYGFERANSILSAFGTSVAFKVTDKATKEFVQNRYGQNRKMFVYKGLSYSEGNKELVTYSNTVEDWQILGLGKGEAIISVSDLSSSPFKFRFKK